MVYVSAYDEHKTELEEQTAKILTPQLITAVKKKLDSELSPVWEAVVDQVLEGAAESVSRVAAERAKKILEAVLAGDEKEAKNLFSLTGFTGRGTERPCIYGRLFEAGPLKLRRALVEAHADLLHDARIADLEDLVEELRKQVTQVEKENERLLRR